MNFHSWRKGLSALFTPAGKHQCSTKEVIVEYTKGPQALNIKSKIIAWNGYPVDAIL